MGTADTARDEAFLVASSLSSVGWSAEQHLTLVFRTENKNETDTNRPDRISHALPIIGVFC